MPLLKLWWLSPSLHNQIKCLIKFIFIKNFFKLIKSKAENY